MYNFGFVKYYLSRQSGLAGVDEIAARGSERGWS